MLLLRTDVNVPPNWVVYLNVLVEDVGDDSSLTRRQVLCLVAIWILLDINSFERTFKSHILEGNVFHASEIASGGNGTDCHTNSVGYFDIAHKDIFRALSKLTSLVHRLHSYGIVKVCDLDTLDEDVLTRWVNSVSVERKRREL